MRPPKRARVVFITGTDTGVGKTVLTALLLAHLRAQGTHALALKPFCSGGRADVRLLQAVQDRELTAEEINPFFFPEPVAPLVAARRHRRPIALPPVLAHIHSMAQRCECLLVEGAGGLLVPLGEGYSIRELIAALQCETIVVSRNKLGTINHTLLTLEALRQPRSRAARQFHSALRIPSSAPLGVVLMECRAHDASQASNPELLQEWIAPTPLISLPFLRGGCHRASAVRRHAKKLKMRLARLGL